WPRCSSTVGSGGFTAPNIFVNSPGSVFGGAGGRSGARKIGTPGGGSGADGRDASFAGPAESCGPAAGWPGAAGPGSAGRAGAAGGDGGAADFDGGDADCARN